MTHPAPTRRWDDIALAALLVGVAALLLTTRRQGMTGDEPRYLLYAASLIRHGSFTMPLGEWSAIHRAATGLPAADLPPSLVGSSGPSHPVYVAALLAPFTLLSAQAPRFVTLMVGLAGLVAVHRLCRLAAGPRAAILTTLVAALTVPLMPYLHLFYMEAWIFALAAFAWWRVQPAGAGLRADLLTAIVITAIPFAHMRGSVVAAALYAFLLWPAVRAGEWRRAALLLLPGIAGLALLVALNLAIHGSITGPVNSARPPLPWAWAEVLPMQLFNVRHGLLAYAPIWILGMAGLAAGAWKDAPLARQGLALLLVAAVTGVGVNPGEGWPARFWVLSMPMLAVGLAHWIGKERGIAMRLPGALLLLLTAINTVLFFAGPNNFLENRQTTMSYGVVFDRVLPLHFGLLLPVELDDPTQRAALARLLLGFGALFLLGIGAMLRPGWRFALPMTLVILGGVDLARVTNLPREAFTLETGNGAARVTLPTPRPLVALQFGDGREMWSYETDNRLDLQVTRADGTVIRQSHLVARQVLPLRCLGSIAAITVTSPTGLDVAGAAAYRLRLYAPASAVERLATRFRIGCGDRPEEIQP
ncbi:hypothetical protein [Roseomonas indoligenes]|uniref:Uncharacterized protein n=1 Tax=Roseomonas indoligenes TaxID=2820811 RepID=A0A940S4Z3_9PROT|nr:hypothetical protein [Pararoseomonas indoligenes]MBP0493841.1 hypothetical protein [Pararoseomonas indoligenes]